MYDVAIIGAGIAGTFIARELSKYKLNTVVIEKENDISSGSTKANTGIVHAGYDAKPGTKMARFNVKGNTMFGNICKELDVPFEKIGSLVVGFDGEDMETIEGLYKRGKKNGVSELEIIDRERIKELEPNIGEEVVGALYAPTAGIVGPWELAIALAENAMDNGVELFLNTKVEDIEEKDGIYKIKTNKKEIEAKYIINCAGVYADEISKMVGEDTFKITPRSGQYYLLDKTAGGIMNTVIFQSPRKFGKGVVVSPTAHGNIIVGPDNEVAKNKDDTETTGHRLRIIRETAEKSIKGIPFNKNITNFTGVRAEPDLGDFIIEEAKEAKGFINVGGIKSPGLTSAPAIAEYVVDILRNIVDDLEEKNDFNPRRKEVIHFEELSDEEKAELIKKEPSYGRIICRCEAITEGEIIDCIKRNAGATTVDGVKRRARPGSGRCQGGFCMPRVMEILSRELNEDITEIVKDGTDSYILTESTKGMENKDE